MKKILLLFSVILLLPSLSFSQLDKPVFQLTLGISEPFDQLKGGDYFTYDQQGYLFIDSSFISKHYAGKTGIQISGSAKINFDKYSITRGVAYLSYNSFNSFETAKSGNTLLNLTSGQTIPVPITFDYGFTSLSFGLGLEVAPLSFTDIVSPFFNGNIAFNFLGGELTRRESGHRDTNRFAFNQFRIGVNFNAGIEVKVNEQFGIVGGVKYDLANLLLKDNDRSISGRLEWGRTSANLNDADGRFYSNLPLNIGSAFAEYRSEEKKINWGTIYLGVNFYPKSKPTSRR
jgi:hypothetical protein